MKRKIVHVTFDMRIGGAEQVIYNLVLNTCSSKYELSILCLNRPIGPFGVQLQEKGFQVTALDRKPGFDLFLVSQVRKYILEHNINILHCHQYTPYVYGVLSAMFTGCNVVFTEHGRFYPDQRKLKRVLLNPFFSVFTSHITAISSATKDALVLFENFPRNKIKIVYNGIDDARYTESVDSSSIRDFLRIHEDAYVLGTVARLDAIKNQKMLLKALKIVRQHYPETVLVIVGDGPERENLEELASQLRLSSHVIFTGFREDVHFFYKVMDLFLLTSFSEGTAMTLLEAMASGLPCIVTDVGGNPEIINDKETGFVIPSDDEEALAERIGLLLGNKMMAANMGKAARKRFEECFTVDKMVRAYERMYEDETDSQ